MIAISRITDPTKKLSSGHLDPTFGSVRIDKIKSAPGAQAACPVPRWLMEGLTGLLALCRPVDHDKARCGLGVGHRKLPPSCFGLGPSGRPAFGYLHTSPPCGGFLSFLRAACNSLPAFQTLPSSVFSEVKTFLGSNSRLSTSLVAEMLAAPSPRLSFILSALASLAAVAPPSPAPSTTSKNVIAFFRRRSRLPCFSAAFLGSGFRPGLRFAAPFEPAPLATCCASATASAGVEHEIGTPSKRIS